MENGKYFLMRKIIAIIIYTLIVILIGRNLTFIPKINPFTNPQKETEGVKNDILDVVKEAPGNYGIYYASLSEKEELSFGINEKQIFTGASVNKIPLVAVLYHFAGKENINLEEQITLRKEDIQDYGTGSLRYREPGSTYSLKALVQLALRQSDNTAAYILSTKIGTDVVQKTIEQWGLTQTDMANNKTSPYDMYIIFKKIYNNEVTTPALTKELLSFLTDSDFEDRIPIHLPGNTKVYHKSGDITGGVHDVGIVEYNGKVFFLGVMTEGIGDKESETKQYIGIIAKKTFGLLHDQ